MDNNILKVKIMGGNYVDILVLDIIEMKATNKKYIIYSLANSDNDDMFISILNESDNNYSLETIEDEKELRMVEDYLIKVNSEEGE